MSVALELPLMHSLRTPVEPALERFRLDADSVRRSIHRRAGSITTSKVPLAAIASEMSDAADLFDASWLRLHEPPPFPRRRSSINIADLFSGCGGLSLGAWEACRALGLEPRFVLSSDLDPSANYVYKANFDPTITFAQPIETIVDGRLGGKITARERRLRREVGSIDLVLAGPPCQGHSDLNNHTRRTDEKNKLVLRIARFAELFEPRQVLIENVQGIRHDKLGSLHLTRMRFLQMGYQVCEMMINAHDVGVPQTRRRYIMFATRGELRPLDRLANTSHYQKRSLSWAISDLKERAGSSPFDTPSTATPPNARRIDFLFDNGLFDLPNTKRPRCHATKRHSYNSVYGRLRWDEPAPTITTGFGCMGQGRFVHPSARRTLTPHEAARLQFFPDFFRFGTLRRGAYQQLIGNAVPPKLAYAILLHQLV